MSLDITERLAIENLLNRYCHCADYDPPESMRELFTADAVFEIPAMNIRCEGIDNIIAFFRSSREVNAGARHVISNVLIEGEGHAANSSAYLQVIQTQGEGNSIAAVGRYVDLLHRDAGGWRLKHRTVVIG